MFPRGSQSFDVYRRTAKTHQCPDCVVSSSCLACPVANFGVPCIAGSFTKGEKTKLIWNTPRTFTPRKASGKGDGEIVRRQ